MSDVRTEARKKAMDLLARREHGRAELECKLVARGFGKDVAADALRQLADEGLQSDRRFVESFVQSRINQGKGPLRIHADLGQRGIAAGLIDEVLEEAGEDWYALARDARLKKFGRSRPAEFRDKARQMRFLQYRGFEPDQIQAAVSSFDD
ncbi:MAG: recombination regulator RecX [Gammaproteobacteria bacterium]|jgi:regulatory protein|nr:recombination regulator RecX [Gammaproteobacteria bacterium]MDH3849166.1 recombination regulator RecX [Gammaproteobacteria bacterium]MDH3862864.1 recombination regulator RecX [Gammaproteobacteria bacterium]MDH3905102.1 recombination regulator RecX [Gammaproteobacteria bacterium]MDH4005378.1 recombination regulator RecX [Gammaproteobacteria bacterium]